ncbi:hypothetical protein [Vibrio agarivorans]|uniref:hypothetical protein n=1 Tax=Vibrio agarivorans TaxID=153622 RepID=UPI0025B44AC1|nr:hypothetical protein [Vibrio agarivorans]MDN3661178.1 hypothetical protein [Vibrio agarivorans]
MKSKLNFNWVETKQNAKHFINYGKQEAFKSLIKATCTLVGGSIAFFIVALIKYLSYEYAKNPLLWMLGSILLGAAILLLASIRYFLTNREDRAKYTNWKSVVMREFLKSFNNSLLLFHAGFQTVYCVAGWIALKSSSFSEKLPMDIKDNMNISNPFIDLLSILGFTIILHIAYNMTINYINANSELEMKRLKEHNPDEEDYSSEKIRKDMKIRKSLKSIT